MSRVPSTPHPHTGLTALPNTSGDTVYYQGLDGDLFFKNYPYQTPAPSDPSPDGKGRKIGILSPLSVIENCHTEPTVYYRDENSILCKAKVEENASGEADMSEIDWLNIQTDSIGKLATLAVEGMGTWVYYQSGSQKAIREIWTMAPSAPAPAAFASYDPLTHASKTIKYTTFSADDILMGTSLAANAMTFPTGQYKTVGSFYFQREDGSVWRNFWDGGWVENMVIPPSDPTSAVFHTGLAATYIPSLSMEVLYYITNAGNLCLAEITVANDASIVSNSITAVNVPAGTAPLPGTSLTATYQTAGAQGGAGTTRVYYQSVDGGIAFVENAAPVGN